MVTTPSRYRYYVVNLKVHIRITPWTATQPTHLARAVVPKRNATSEPLWDRLTPWNFARRYPIQGTLAARHWIFFD
jgi:hypothetical protein